MAADEGKVKAALDVLSRVRGLDRGADRTPAGVQLWARYSSVCAELTGEERSALQRIWTCPANRRV
jgi:hypothetical protein